MIRIADDIRVWRLTYRLSQEDAGAIAGVSGKTWGRWEREQTHPREDHYNTLRYIVARPPYGVEPDSELPARP
jgi:transcriptional regulator with XRE-family HTH domain